MSGLPRRPGPTPDTEYIQSPDTQQWVLGIAGPRILRGRIYNGNQRLIVNHLTIEVRSQEGGRETRRSYSVSKRLLPLSTEEFDVEILEYPRTATWTIEAAEGSE
jgi:hypothetical protein